MYLQPHFKVLNYAIRIQQDMNASLKLTCITLIYVVYSNKIERPYYTYIQKLLTW